MPSTRFRDLHRATKPSRRGGAGDYRFAIGEENETKDLSRGGNLGFNARFLPRMSESVFRCLCHPLLGVARFQDDVVTGRLLAAAVLVCVALCFWMFQIGRDPKGWRLRWLDFFGLLDADTPREQRLSQEGQLRFMAYVVLLLLGAMAASCAFWSFDQVRESRRPKTSLERQVNDLRREVDEMKGRR